jgi:NADH-quinone oxidoreductase subunit M
MFGEVSNKALFDHNDLSWREKIIFTPLVIGTILLGVYPNFVFYFTTISVSPLVETYRNLIGG